jgi:hypothetical protein
VKIFTAFYINTDIHMHDSAPAKLYNIIIRIEARTKKDSALKTDKDKR